VFSISCSRVPFCVPAACVVSLSVSFYSTQTGLCLGLGGYSQKQHVLLSAILAQMRSLRAVDKPKDFARLKETMRRGLLNFAKDNPYQHAVYDEVRAMEDVLWSHEEKLAIIDSLTPEQLDVFSAQL